jgi:hypothetical protein
MGILVSTPPYLTPLPRPYCQHLSLVPFPLIRRKSYPRQLTANHGWASVETKLCSLCQRYSKKSHQLSQLNDTTSLTPPFSPLQDYNKPSLSTTTKYRSNLLKPCSHPLKIRSTRSTLLHGPTHPPWLITMQNLPKYTSRNTPWLLSTKCKTDPALFPSLEDLIN